jgi:hypothetical protein
MNCLSNTHVGACWTMQFLFALQFLRCARENSLPSSGFVAGRCQGQGPNAELGVLGTKQNRPATADR